MLGQQPQRMTNEVAQGLVSEAQVMGQTEIMDLLNQNLSQEEETASIAEPSTEELLPQVG